MTAEMLPGLAPARAIAVRITATPSAINCPDCRSDVIAGWRDRVGPTVLADPVALTPLGELQALAAGRRTFSHWHDGLGERRPWVIARVPAGAGDNPVRPEHKCGSPPIDAIPETSPAINDENDSPPF